MTLPGVSETALGAAEMRAEESVRPDRLFDDEYAAMFVAAAPPLFPDLPSINDDAELLALKQAGVAEIALRTRFYDDYIMKACEDGCRQAVLLAAGLDARAFRLDWPTDLQMFELDLPALFEFKEAVLTQHEARPRCARTVVAVDLRDDWTEPLADAGFDMTAPCAWAAEGLLPYLSHDEVVDLLTAVGELSASGSRLSFEYDDFVEDSTLSHARAMKGMEQVTSMWEGGLQEPPDVWLRDHDWEVRTRTRVELAKSYGRALPNGTGGFLTARRL